MQISTVAQSASPVSTNAQTNRTSDEGQSGSGDFASLLFPQASGKSENAEAGSGLEGDTDKDQQQPSSQQQQAAAQVILQMMGISGLVSVLPVKATEAAMSAGNVSSAADQTTTGSVSANHTVADNVSATGAVYTTDFSNWVATNVLSGDEAGTQTTTLTSSGQDTVQTQTGHIEANSAGLLSGNPDMQSTVQNISDLSTLQTTEQAGKIPQAIPVFASRQGADTTASASVQTAAVPTLQSRAEAATSSASSSATQAAALTSMQTAAVPTLQSGAEAATFSASSSATQAAAFTSPQTASMPTLQAGTAATTSLVSSLNVQATVFTSTRTAAVPTSQSGMAATTSSASSSATQAAALTSTQTAAVPTSQSGMAAATSSANSSATQVAPVFTQTVEESDSHPTPSSVNTVNAQAVSPNTIIAGTAEPASNETATQSGAGGGHSAASSGQDSQNTAGKADASVQTFPSVLPGLSGQAVTASSVQSPVSSYLGTVAKQITSAVQDAYAAQRSELRVHLSPEDLGGITIKMVSQGGSLTVSIIADSHHTGQMLASGLDSLKNTLQSNGVPVQKAEVFHTPSDTTGQQPAAQQYTGQNPQQQRGRHTSDGSQQETRDTGETAAGFASLVNLFA